MMSPRVRLSLALMALFLIPAWRSAGWAATINVNAGGNLQAALDAAQPGDTIVLQAGATFEGSFVLRYKPGTGTDADWITIRTSTPDSSLPPGERVLPSDAPLLAKIASPGLAQPALQTEPRAHHYRLIGLELAPKDAQAFLYDVVLLGTSGPDQDTPEEVPHHLVIDRCWIHAYPTQSLKRGIQLNSASTDILNSYIAGFKVVGQDSQAIGAFNGPGPYKIINNYLEGAGENVIFGGADPSIPNLVPSDIEIRRNHFAKPLSWYFNDPSYAGIHWSVKNLFELKNAQRVLIDGNIFEYNWGDAQVGYAILFTVRNQDGTAPWSVVRDVVMTNNIVRHSASAIQLLGTDYIYPSQQTERITVANNVFEDIDGARWNGAGWFLTISDGLVDFKVDHNTVFQSSNIISAGGTPSTRFIFNNNIMPHNDYGVHGDSRGTGNDALSTYFPGYTFRRNVIAGANPAFYPADNFFPATLDNVGFVNRAGGNYRLAPGSPYKGQGTDGKDPGADIDAVAAATAGVVSGVWTAPAGQAPYGGSPAAAPGTIEAEKFDEGGETVAWHDVDAGNNGGEYRTGDVDIRSKSTASNGHVVFNAMAGEWLEYTINVAAAGTYDIGATSASRLAGGTYHIEIDGVDVTGPLTAPTTGSWWDFQYAGRAGVSLSAGTHVLRLALDTNGVEGIVADFDTIVISAADPLQTPFQGAPFAVPGTVSASDFDNGGEGVAYHDTTPGNVSGSPYRTSDVDMYDQSVLWLSDGEWLEYTVDVGAAASTYAFVAQVSAEQAGGSLHIEVDGVDKTGALAVPATGSWAIWGSAVKTGVSLPAGRHVVRVAADSHFDGFHSLRIVNTGSAQSPFGGTARTLPGTISAADFDEGGEMISYHDNTAGCSGSCGSRTADVDRWDQVVYQTGAGEWLEYTVDVAAAGTYKIQVRTGSQAGGGTFHVEFDGVDVTGPLTVPNTGGWNTFQAVTKTGVALSAGRKVMRIVMDDDGGAGPDAGSFESITVTP
jgi:hypothetical protein